jgi:predicted Zn-ribbon and HTH transcriptional regulator
MSSDSSYGYPPDNAFSRFLEDNFSYEKRLGRPSPRRYKMGLIGSRLAMTEPPQPLSEVFEKENKQGKKRPVLRHFTEAQRIKLKQFGIEVPANVYDKAELDAIDRKCGAIAMGIKAVNKAAKPKFTDRLHKKIAEKNKAKTHHLPVLKENMWCYNCEHEWETPDYHNCNKCPNCTIEPIHMYRTSSTACLYAQFGKNRSKNEQK